MTRDEVRELIAEAIKPYNKPDRDLAANAVLAAFAARGIVLGEMAKLSEEENGLWTDVFSDCDEAEDFTACFDGTVDGLALVRVVPND